MVNEKQTYALINADTKKIIKHNGNLQYFRLKQTAHLERNKLQTELGIKIGITQRKPSIQGQGRPKKVIKKENEKI